MPDWLQVAREFRAPIYLLKGVNPNLSFRYHIATTILEKLWVNHAGPISRRETPLFSDQHAKRLRLTVQGLFVKQDVPKLQRVVWVELATKLHRVELGSRSRFNCLGDSFVREFADRNLDETHLVLYCHYFEYYDNKQGREEVHEDDPHFTLLLELAGHSSTPVRFEAVFAIANLLLGKRHPVRAEPMAKVVLHQHFFPLYDAIAAGPSLRLRHLVGQLLLLAVGPPEIEVALAGLIQRLATSNAKEAGLFESIPSLWARYRRSAELHGIPDTEVQRLEVSLLTQINQQWDDLGLRVNAGRDFSACLLWLCKNMSRSPASQAALERVSEVQLTACLHNASDWLLGQPDAPSLVALLADRLPHFLVVKAVAHFCSRKPTSLLDSGLQAWLTGMADLVSVPMLTSLIAAFYTTQECWDLARELGATHLLASVAQHTTDPEFLAVGLATASAEPSARMSHLCHNVFFVLLSRGYRLPPDFDFAELASKYWSNPRILRPLLYAQGTVSA